MCVETWPGFSLSPSRRDPPRAELFWTAVDPASADRVDTYTAPPLRYTRAPVDLTFEVIRLFCSTHLRGNLNWNCVSKFQSFQSARVFFFQFCFWFFRIHGRTPHQGLFICRPEKKIRRRRKKNDKMSWLLVIISRCLWESVTTGHLKSCDLWDFLAASPRHGPDWNSTDVQNTQKKTEPRRKK